jgi:CheY-like chemotaxis protein
MGNLKGKKVLIAEDEPPMLDALATGFGGEGCVVLKATDGEEALGFALKEKPDLILLDILMPKVSGTEVLESLRKANDWGRKVPVVILTNLSADDRIMKDVVKNEPSFYLVKTDWRLEEVVLKARQCVGD